MRTILLYHGNTESAVDEIVRANKLLDKYKSIGDKHYLGDGFYFYEDVVQASVWAKMKVKRKYKGTRWAILECKIEVEEDEFLDLDKRDEQDFFFLEMKRANERVNNGSISSKDKSEIMEYSDAYLCNYIADMLQLSLLSKTFVYKDMFKTYPSLFSNKKSSPYLITRHFRTEKQYVIKNSNIVVSLQKVHIEDGEIREVR
jgi:hypothetical protein